ncbi:MAG: DUF3488 and transglutaminase-like domain-containing protein [Alysiella sp.]|uniref:transglutaminase family protein n=1 Tax=Alysiella sp. TaxID=1872483 RepID=UPI0026DCD2EF|nr:DUF3488 and transglutaminase-like domain-containing protein [Alysiella sp.]MDO4433765.1 DUF3488 and transglutaminase-like domain-containing protein [Alysiella sp.]
MSINLPNPTYLNSTPDFKAMLFVLSSLAAVSVPLLMQLPLGVVSIFGFLLLVRIILLFYGIRSLKIGLLLPLMLGVIALVMGQLGTIFGLEGGISFLLLLAVLKSCEGETRRDWQVLVMAMLFLLTGAVLFEQGLFTALWVFLCLMMMGISLSMLNHLDFKSALHHSFIGFLLTLLPMLLLFVTMPRRASPLWGVPQMPAAQSTTGISESMKPGSIGNLILSNEPAFSATFDNGITPRQNQLYWRMMIMGEYRDGAWHTLKEYRDRASPAESTPHISYQLIAEDQDGRIPALDYPFTSQRRGIYHEMGNVLRTYSREGVRRLRLEASLSDRLPHQLNDSEIAFYTRLPENTNLQTRLLAQKLHRQSGGDTETFIHNAYRYFTEQGFVYTLKPPVFSGNNTTDDFLFTSRQGFCEHYADAFVVMMRAAGIPARVVTGYQGGEYNEAGEFWQIRSKDAHAWTEVWLANQQVWQRIDPTAAVAAERIENGVNAALPESEAGELSGREPFWQAWADQSRFYWQQWVVNYDDTRQQSLFAKLGFDKVSPSSILMVLLLGCLPALIPIWLWWRRSRKQDIEPLSYGFMLLKRRLLGKDYPNLATIAPMELRQILHDDDLFTPDLAQLLNEYIKLNYASPQSVAPHQANAWYKRACKMSRKYRQHKD